MTDDVQKCLDTCERMIAEAQSQIDALARSGGPRSAQDIWLGRRIGVEAVAAMIRRNF